MDTCVWHPSAAPYLPPEFCGSYPRRIAIRLGVLVPAGFASASPVRMMFELDAFSFRFRVPVRAGLLVRRLSGTKFQKGRALAMKSRQLKRLKRPRYAFQ